jgi:hypothetical protein
VLALALAVAACDGGDDGSGGEVPTFGELHERVFMPSCVFAACHKGAAPAGMMSLEPGAAHASLVGAEAFGEPGRIRVVAGDPDASYLMDKLTAESVAAGLMPPTEPLDDERLELVRAWIEAGAADD